MKRNKLSVIVITGLMLVCGSAGWATPWSPPTEGLVGYWSFDNSAWPGLDDSGNGHDGTVYGATWTTGKFGGALSFDGVDDYVGTSNNIFSNAQLASGATLAAWFKTDSTAYGYIADDEGYINLGINHIYAPSPDKLVGMVDGGYHRFFSGANVNDNLWHHAAIVWNGTDTAILYLDGVDVSSGFSGPPNPDDKNRPFAIGAHSSLTESSFFDGVIDDVRIYDRALSASEIEALIPEPATLLLLGSGGLALLRKRRW